MGKRKICTQSVEERTRNALSFYENYVIDSLLLPFIRFFQLELFVFFFSYLLLPLSSTSLLLCYSL